MYECTICLTLNHASRLHCQNCGSAPKMYSWTGYEINEVGTEAIAAKGCRRASQHHASRVYLRTVTADYYAQE